MISQTIELLLADDDNDDCFLFKEALAELPINANLSIVNDGEKLMNVLLSDADLPTLLFLDLNMPRKNGLECLCEIKLNQNLKNLPVIIFSTAAQEQMVESLYKNGAVYFLKKPNNFEKLKQIIELALSYTINGPLPKTPIEKFVL